METLREKSRSLIKESRKLREKREVHEKSEVEKNRPKMDGFVRTTHAEIFEKFEESEKRCPIERVIPSFHEIDEVLAVERQKLAKEGEVDLTDPNESRPQSHKGGRPLKRKIDKSKLLRASVPPWFERVLSYICEKKNSQLLKGEKKWGQGRAIRFIYSSLFEAWEREERQLGKFIARIDKLHLRRDMVEKKELIEVYGKEKLSKAFVQEVEKLEELQWLLGFKTGELRAILPKNDFNKLESLYYKKTVVVKELSSTYV